MRRGLFCILRLRRRARCACRARSTFLEALLARRCRRRCGAQHVPPIARPDPCTSRSAGTQRPPGVHLPENHAYPQLVGNGAVCCYLDSDQIAAATSERVDDIFDLDQPPIMFAPDASTINQFSRYAVNCPCRSGTCRHLREEIRARFGIDIPDGKAHHWNGGLYLFDRASTDFAQSWHGNTLLTFGDAYWRIRDQGTLLVTQWQFGLQDHPLIPQNASRIIDRFFGYSEAVRKSLRPDQFFIGVGTMSCGAPIVLHFFISLTTASATWVGRCGTELRHLSDDSGEGMALARG